MQPQWWLMIQPQWRLMPQPLWRTVHLAYGTQSTSPSTWRLPLPLPLLLPLLLPLAFHLTLINLLFSRSGV